MLVDTIAGPQRTGSSEPGITAPMVFHLPDRESAAALHHSVDGFLSVGTSLPSPHAVVNSGISDDSHLAQDPQCSGWLPGRTDGITRQKAEELRAVSQILAAAQEAGLTSDEVQPGSSAELLQQLTQDFQSRHKQHRLNVVSMLGNLVYMIPVDGYRGIAAAWQLV